MTIATVLGAAALIDTHRQARPVPVTYHWPVRGLGSLPAGKWLPAAGGQSAFFRISGQVLNLYPTGTGTSPGPSQLLYLQVSNPFSFNINVTQLTVAAGSVTNTTANYTCSSSLLWFNPSPDSTGAWNQGSIKVTEPTPIFIVAGGTVTAPAIPVMLDVSAPNACAGQQFPLQFGGAGVQA